MTDKLIHRRDILLMLGVCAKTLSRWRESGKLPEPDVNINPRSQWWKVGTLAAAGLAVANQPTPEASADAQA